MSSVLMDWVQILRRKEIRLRAACSLMGTVPYLASEMSVAKYFGRASLGMSVFSQLCGVVV